MSLFGSEKLKKPVSDIITSSIVVCSDNIVTVQSNSLKEIIGDPFMGKSVVYSTRGRWSMHDMINYFLQYTGPADVYFTSWSITPKPLKGLIDLKQKGKILNLNGVVDSRIAKTSPDSVAIAKANNIKMKTAEIHAKCCVIRNQRWGISILSSQNFTLNKRVEAGSVFFSNEVAQFNINWIQNLIDNGKELI